jgi:hypothetical protein
MNWMDISTTIYARLLYLYPASVRRNDGAAMMQIFRDLAREELRMGSACGASEARSRRARASGGGAPRALTMTGLVRLWTRTGIDLLKSVPDSYLRHSHEPAGNAARRLAMIYALCVVAFVAYGAIGFREYYTRPSWSVDPRAGTAVIEDKVLSEWNAVAPHYGRYIRYWQTGGVAITMLLGVTAAFFARWQKSLGHGLGALAAGWIATAAALHLMPFVYFPFDQYPVGFLWMFELPLALIAFGVAVIIVRLKPDTTC